MMLRFKDVAVPVVDTAAVSTRPSQLPARLLTSINPPQAGSSSHNNAKWVYPGGEVGVRVGPGEWSTSGMYRVQNAEDLVALIMGLDARQRTPPGIRDIFIPYLPYARQDRVAAPGDPLAIQVLAGMFAGYGLETIWTVDVHSPQAARQFATMGIELISVSPIAYIRKYIDGLKLRNYVLVSPDKGALGKTTEYMKQLPDASGMVVCNKARDPVSGRLSRSEVDSYVDAATGTSRPIKPEDFVGVTPVIVDDICDGGRTFVNVASALKAAGNTTKPHLWTTHGIYSNGLTQLLDVFDTLGSTDSFLNKQADERLTTIPIREG